MHLPLIKPSGIALRFGGVYLSNLSKPMSTDRKFSLELTEGDAKAQEAKCFRTDAGATDNMTIQFELNQCYDGHYLKVGSWYPEIRFIAPPAADPQQATPDPADLHENIPAKLQALKQLLVRATPVATIGMLSPETLIQQINKSLDYRIWQAEKRVQASRQLLDESRQQFRTAEAGHAQTVAALSEWQEAKGET